MQGLKLPFPWCYSFSCCTSSRLRAHFTGLICRIAERSSAARRASPPTLRHAQPGQRCSRFFKPVRDTTFAIRQPSCVASAHDWEMSHSVDPPLSFGCDQVSPQQSQTKPWPFSVWVLLTLASPKHMPSSSPAPVPAIYGSASSSLSAAITEPQKLTGGLRSAAPALSAMVGSSGT
jgi:hypothetical protein